jgi:phosphoglycerate dehydrogenase-like enzyme
VADRKTPPALSIWCNLTLPEAPRAALLAGLGPHRLVWATNLAPLNVFTGNPDPALAEADVAFGQPEGSQCADLPRLRWVHLSSAGYTPFDTPTIKAALTARQAALSTSSGVFAEPCAQHVLAVLLTQARQLPHAFENQRGAHAWPKKIMREGARLLRGQNVLLVGMGTIGARLAELLAPFGMKVTGVRRSAPAGATVAGTTVVPVGTIYDHLPHADYVIDLLPGSADSERFFDAARFAAMKPGAIFVNIGRGTTVDQEALVAALTSGHLAAAFLDVTTPEPLPPEHALWTAPGCVITPHSAGGHADQPDRLVAHFLANLARYDRGADLLDRVV